MKKLTPKQIVLTADPESTLDYYELLRGQGKPCWFIRVGVSGPPRTPICASPRAAWKHAADSFMAYLRKAAA